MIPSEAVIGTWVRTAVDWPDVPAGSIGLICEDYGSGVTVAWDLEWKPVPKDMAPEAIGKMWAINPRCPLRDGFNKAAELHFLDHAFRCVGCPAILSRPQYDAQLGRCNRCACEKYGVYS